jgi:SAM-dependent methyltransferase
VTTIRRDIEGQQSPKAAPSSRAVRPAAPTSWDALARWYDGWMGEDGSDHHRALAIPTLMCLLNLRTGERLLDAGCGQGVLAPYVAEAGAQYTGVDAAPRLLDIARRRHGRHGRFLLGDTRDLAALPQLAGDRFDAVTFLLSIQDMDPLDDVLASAAWALKPGGRVVLLLVHPAFRVPRQSGWGWDASRKLHYRRVDSYLTPLAVPMKTLPSGKSRGKLARPSTTRSFHRPLGAYVNGLSASGLLVDGMEEVPAHNIHAPPAKTEYDDKAAERARREIPLFLGLRARKPLLMGGDEAVRD